MSDNIKPFVYIASPYTNGDPAINARFQCRIFDEMMDDGIAWPCIPLLLHYQHMLFPRHDQNWIDYEVAVIKRFGFDACLRLDATYEDWYLQEKSPGADAEVKLFKSMKIPVFYTKTDLYGWVFNEERARRESTNA